jgi:hypothetical protein
LAIAVLAVVAVGAHTISLTAPALAQQDREARKAEAAAEQTILPRTPTASSDGMPVPALVGGIVLAFAVGLTGGQLHRRRRATVRRRTTAALPAVEAPARPAPRPPSVAAVVPVPMDLAPAPAPAPPPPKPRRTPRRVVRPPAAPARPAPQPPEPAGEAPLTDSPEVPRPEEVPSGTVDRSAPLAEAPEAPTVPEPAAPPQPEPATSPPAEAAALPVAEPALPAEPTPPVAEPTPPAKPARPAAPAPSAKPARPAPAEPRQAPEPAAEPAGSVPPPVPARRFARPKPWPAEARHVWTCEIGWKAGYRKSSFRAMAGPPGSAKRAPIGESRVVAWTLMADPEPPTPELATRVRALMQGLEAAGWEHIGRGGHWYAQRFLWRGTGEPQAIVVPDLVKAGEPPEA